MKIMDNYLLLRLALPFLYSGLLGFFFNAEGLKKDTRTRCRTLRETVHIIYAVEILGEQTRLGKDCLVC